MPVDLITPDEMTHYTGLDVSIKRRKRRYFFPRHWPHMDVHYPKPPGQIWEVEHVGRKGVKIRARIPLGSGYHQEEVCTVRLSWEVVEAVVQTAMRRLRNIEVELDEEITRRIHREFNEELERNRRLSA